MTQVNHTPWSVGSHPWPEQIGCCPLVGRPFSVHSTDHHNVAAAVSEDIARLIAAAPELLEALRSLVANLDEGDFISTTRIDAARAAIARATGEKP